MKPQLQFVLLYFLILILYQPPSLFAQQENTATYETQSDDNSYIEVEEVLDIEEAVNNLLGLNSLGIVTNLTSVTGTDFGDVNGIGSFDSPDTDFPVTSGLILSTGEAVKASGPKTNIQSFGTHDWLGDSNIEEIIAEVENIEVENAVSYNATIIEFDFIPFSEEFNFNFVFASEEYGIFQCSFSDAFAFLLTDPSGEQTNLAVVPETEIPISVLTIRDELYNSNCSSENEEYFDTFYTNSENIEGEPANNAPVNFSGNTVLLNAQSDLIPGEEYHIKLVIADKLDAAYDSAVFIENDSFNIGNVNLGESITPENENSLCLGETVTLNTGIVKVDGVDINWYRNNELISDENNEEIEIFESGTYSVEVSLDPEIFGVDKVVEDSIEIEFLPTPSSERMVVEDLYGCTLNNQYTFDLTENNSNLLDEENPDDFVIDYFLTEPDAQNNISPIESPESFDFEGSEETEQIIYARIEGFSLGERTGCYEVFSFNLLFQEAAIANEVEDLEPLENDDEFYFDLSQNESQILGNQNSDDFRVLYYTSESDALESQNSIENPEYFVAISENQTIWARVENKNHLECFDLTDFNLLTDYMDVENFAKPDVKFWPNPVKNILNIESESPIINVQVFDIKGQELINKSSSKLDLSQLSTGVYFLKIQNQKGIKTQKIIKK